MGFYTTTSPGVLMGFPMPYVTPVGVTVPSPTISNTAMVLNGAMSTRIRFFASCNSFSQALMTITLGQPTPITNFVTCVPTVFYGSGNAVTNLSSTMHSQTAPGLLLGVTQTRSLHASL